MKKLIMTLAVVLGIAATTQASSYKLDENKMEQTFQQSTDVTSTLTANLNNQVNGMYGNAVLSSGSEWSGYLLRAFFCGVIALHRTYMGGKKSLLWYYLCIPCAGGLAAEIDFFWVLFKKSALDKYRNNDKFFVAFAKS